MAIFAGRAFGVIRIIGVASSLDKAGVIIVRDDLVKRAVEWCVRLREKYSRSSERPSLGAKCSFVAGGFV